MSFLSKCVATRPRTNATKGYGRAWCGCGNQVRRHKTLRHTLSWFFVLLVLVSQVLCFACRCASTQSSFPILVLLLRRFFLHIFQACCAGRTRQMRHLATHSPNRRTRGTGFHTDFRVRTHSHIQTPVGCIPISMYHNAFTCLNLYILVHTLYESQTIFFLGIFAWYPLSVFARGTPSREIPIPTECCQLFRVLSLSHTHTNTIACHI